MLAIVPFGICSGAGSRRSRRRHRWCRFPLSGSAVGTDGERRVERHAIPEELGPCVHRGLRSLLALHAASAPLDLSKRRRSPWYVSGSSPTSHGARRPSRRPPRRSAGALSSAICTAKSQDRTASLEGAGADTVHACDPSPARATRGVSGPSPRLFPALEGAVIACAGEHRACQNENRPRWTRSFGAERTPPGAGTGAMTQMLSEGAISWGMPARGDTRSLGERAKTAARTDRAVSLPSDRVREAARWTSPVSPPRRGPCPPDSWTGAPGGAPRRSAADPAARFLPCPRSMRTSGRRTTDGW